MQLEIISFSFGIVIALAVLIVIEKIYGKIFGNKRLRELQREVKRLQNIIQKKDELIKKSLKTIETMENKKNANF